MNDSGESRMKSDVNSIRTRLHKLESRVKGGDRHSTPVLCVEEQLRLLGESFALLSTEMERFQDTVIALTKESNDQDRRLNALEALTHREESRLDLMAENIVRLGDEMEERKDRAIGHTEVLNAHYHRLEALERVREPVRIPNVV